MMPSATIRMDASGNQYPTTDKHVSTIPKLIILFPNCLIALTVALFELVDENQAQMEQARWSRFVPNRKERPPSEESG